MLKSTFDTGRHSESLIISPMRPVDELSVDLKVIVTRRSRSLPCLIIHITRLGPVHGETLSRQKVAPVSQLSSLLLPHSSASPPDCQPSMMAEISYRRHYHRRFCNFSYAAAIANLLVDALPVTSFAASSLLRALFSILNQSFYLTVAPFENKVSF